jgi:hypothetical protein
MAGLSLPSLPGTWQSRDPEGRLKPTFKATRFTSGTGGGILAAPKAPPKLDRARLRFALSPTARPNYAQRFHVHPLPTGALSHPMPRTFSCSERYPVFAGTQSLKVAHPCS